MRLRGQIGGRVFQKDLNNPKASKQARQAWWIEIRDCEGALIREKIGEYNVATRVLAILIAEKAKGKLFKKYRDATVDMAISKYAAAKLGERSNLANIETVRSALRTLSHYYGKIRLKDMTRERHERIKNMMKQGRIRKQAKTDTTLFKGAEE